ncbi:transposase [Streptomyces sp. NPDC126497]|uniref:transposase n=1 Tax=Streptomyces sp. NPDC126497 TaxID=3155313 RepID=UPI0033173750
MSLSVDVPGSEALDLLSRFRAEFYECLYQRADALFELTDAVLCTDGPVKTLVELSLAVEHRRGHGALYAALDRGWLEPARLRRVLAGLPLPRAADGRIVLAVDVSHWLRPDAPTSDQRLFCHVHGRGDRKTDQFVPGWPYSFVAALETGRTSWVALLDAVRLGPADDATQVTARQLRDVAARLIAAGYWRPGDAEVLIVMDSGYDTAYLTHALADLPVVRSDVCVRTASCSALPAPPAPDRAAGAPADRAASSPLPNPTPGTPPTSLPPPTPPATAPPRRRPGTGCTPDSPTAAPGWSTPTKNCPSSTAH